MILGQHMRSSAEREPDYLIGPRYRRLDVRVLSYDIVTLEKDARSRAEGSARTVEIPQPVAGAIAMRPEAIVAGLDMAEVRLEEGELVETGILLTKIVGANGAFRLSMTYPDGQSWLERYAMVDLAAECERAVSMEHRHGGRDE